MRYFPSGLARTKAPTNSQIAWQALWEDAQRSGKGKFIRFSTLGTGHSLFPHLAFGGDHVGVGVVRGPGPLHSSLLASQCPPVSEAVMGMSRLLPGGWEWWCGRERDDRHCAQWVNLSPRNIS
jgi:hypothetical protein